MNTKTITIEISTDGQVKITTEGFTGIACKDATKTLEQALGAVTSDTPTREAHEYESVHLRNRS